MEITYLKNDYIFLELYSKISKGKIKIEEIKINPILKYLDKEELEKVYENVISLKNEIEKIEINTENIEKVFKFITVKQTNIMPIESYNIEVLNENLNMTMDIIEKIKTITFLCSSNISLVIKNNANSIEQKIEKKLFDIKKFTFDKRDTDLLEIMIRDNNDKDNELEEDLILSINAKKELVKNVEDSISKENCSNLIIDMMNEIANYIKTDILPILVEEESLIKIEKKENDITFRYNKAIVNELPENVIEDINNKCKNLITYIENSNQYL